MGNIINDIIEDVNIKPNKSKFIIKWIVSISISLITIAFIFGQLKSTVFNRINNSEKSINNNTTGIEMMRTEIKNGFNNVDVRIDKIYTDGFAAFDDYQQFNKKQLILVLDYGQTNKNLLKEMLEINMLEKTRNIENQIQQTMNTSVNTQKSKFSIGVKKIESEKNKDYISISHKIYVETNDTIFYLTGATKEYINKINKNKYIVSAIIENSNYPNLYDVNYRNK